MKHRISFLVLLFSLFLRPLNAQTTQGTDFWLTPMINLVASDSFFVIVSAEKATTVKVEVPLQGFSETVSLGYNDLKRVFIPKSLRPSFQDSVQNCGIHVTSNLQISVYAISAASHSTDATCVFPSDVQPKGGTYYTLNPIVYQAGYNSRNTFSIVCIDDSCLVDIIPATTTVKGRTGGVLFKRKLYKGQVYVIGAGAKVGLEGSYIKAEAGKRIAVFSGDECVAVRCAACDHVYEVIPPTTTLGKTFIVDPFHDQDKGYDYQVVASENTTTITENGTTVAVLDQGKTFYRKVFGDSSLCITADKPVLVIQYMTGIVCQAPKGGDPAMLLINPMEQTITKAIVSTANTTVIKTHYITIIVPLKAIDSVFLDGVLMPNTKFKQLPCGNYYVYSDTIRAGNHRIECRYGFISYLYGIGGAESYAYSAGSGLRNLKRYIVSKSYPSCDSGFIVKLTSVGDSATAYRWTFNNKDKDTAKSPFFYVSKPGVYPVKLAYLPYGKISWDSTTLDVLVEKPEFSDFILFKERTICDSSYRIELPNTPIFSYLWNTGATTPYLVTKKSGTYSVKIHNKITGCDIADTAKLTFHNKVNIKMGYKMTMFCPGIPLYLYDSTKVTNDTVIGYSWYADKTLRSKQKNDTIKSPKANEYEIKLVVNTIKGCRDSVETKIFISDIPVAVMGVVRYDSCYGTNRFRFNNGSYSNLGKIVRYKWLFGDGDTAAGQQAFKSYKDSGVFNARLIAFSEKGCFDTSDIFKVKVHPTPASKIAIRDSSICLSGNYFDFANATIPDGKPKGYLWDWGDGAGSTFENPGQIAFLDTGTYKVRMVAYYTETGCGDTARRTIRINENPKASLVIDSFNFCLNNNYYLFRNTSDAKGVTNKSITWKWGDGTTTVDTFTYAKKFTSAGTFKVKMYFSTGKGCLDSAQKNVIIYNTPKALFSVTESKICGTDNYFKFKNESTAPGNAKWNWQFGDGQSALVKDPGTITYTTFGTFNVQLAVLDPLTTCSDTFAKKVEVFKAPSVKARVSDSVACTKSGQFKFTDSTEYGNLKPTRMWTFNSNALDTNSAATLVKTFNTRGLQKVMFVGGVPGLCVDTMHMEVNIRYNDSPASISHVLQTQCLPGTTQLNANIKEGNNWTYLWDPQNGSTYNTKNVSAINYKTAGKYYIHFTITDDIQCKFSLLDSVTVYPELTAAMAHITNDSQCLTGNVFEYQNTLTNGTAPFAFQWDLGEGIQSADPNPANIQYTQTGPKNIRLIVSDKLGCRDTITGASAVMPVPSIVIYSDSGCEGETKIMAATLSPNGIQTEPVVWKRDGVEVFKGNPYQAVLKPAGASSLQAFVETAFGCADTSAMAYLKAFPKPEAKFGIKTLTPTGLGIPVQFLDSSTGAIAWTWVPETGFVGTGIPYSYLYPRIGKTKAYLIVESGDNCLDTAALDFELFSDEYGWFPGSFTPNGNGTNDVFKPGGLSVVKNYTMIVYNRWGQKMFETTNPEIGWDGTFMGSPVPEGVYAYAVNLVYLTGKRYVVHGEVTLLR